MSFTNYPNGITSFGIPVYGNIPAIRGKVFFVDPKVGLAGNPGTKAKPLNTLKSAYDKCVTGRGDAIILLSFASATSADHTSYLDAALDWTKSGITVVGVTAPTMFAQRARIANASTLLTAPYLIKVSGHANAFYNLSMFNGGSDAAALGCLQVSGNRNYFYNVHAVGAGHATPSAAADAVNLELIGASENTFEKCVFGTDTINRVGTLTTYDIEFSSGCARNVFKDCITLSQTTSGQAGHLGIRFDGAGDAINRNQYFMNCHFSNYNEGVISDQTSLVGGTLPNNGKLVMHGCSSLGYAAWDSAGADTVFTDQPQSNAAGGIMAGA
jgi:hypothetical protein